MTLLQWAGAAFAAGDATGARTSKSGYATPTFAAPPADGTRRTILHERSFETITASQLTWRDDGGIAVTWSDGHHSVYSRPYLRANCPCATCQGTHGTPTTLVDATAKPDAPKKKFGGFKVMTGPKPPPVDVAIQIKQADPIGQYGMKLTWGDGHNTGIYTWQYLRTISPGDGTAAHPPTEAAQQARSKAKEAAGSS
ncbi:MAG: DUF971 domain-containing protein [Myxococcales bacterium]|nr:DUF971 domain-containing protein [Myxococcales bacterium]